MKLELDKAPLQAFAGGQGGKLRRALVLKCCAVDAREQVQQLWSELAPALKDFPEEEVIHT